MDKILKEIKKLNYELKGTLHTSLVELYKKPTNGELLFYGEHFEGWVLQIHRPDRTFIKKSVGRILNQAWIHESESDLAFLILDSSEWKKSTIKKHITHQNIGGQEFEVDDHISKTLTVEEVINKANNGNIACANFIMRRMDDITLDFPHRLYYVKINNLGYVIADDEIERGD